MLKGFEIIIANEKDKGVKGENKMKKLLAVICIVMLCMASAIAGVKGIVNLKPYFNMDNSPSGITPGLGHVGWTLPANWWETSQDHWLRAFSVPTFMDLGLEARTDNFRLVFLMDIGQDTLQRMKDNGNIKTNIPFVGATLDLNMPKVGFIDYTSTNGNFYASAGRRQIKWGPSTYDMALSDSQPYLDNVYLMENVPMKNGWNFFYNFIGIAYKFFLNYYGINIGPKSTFTHKFGFESSNLRFSVAELNMVYDKYPTLLDFTPCGVWHDNYQDSYSNVMLNAAAEAIAGPLRLFGTFTMDDFDLPHEADATYGISNKPQAMGFTAGIELNLFDGQAIKASDFNYQDYVLRDKTFKKNTGLNIGYEFYYCSTFMYNRDNAAGKYVVPFQFISMAGDGYSYDVDAFYLGFKYGPNTMVHRFYAEYADNPVELNFAAELIKRGSYLIGDPYGDNSVYHSMGLKEMKLTDPVTTVLKLEAGAAYFLQEGFKLNGSFGYTKDLTHDAHSISVRLGGSISVTDVDWKNLF